MFTLRFYSLRQKMAHTRVREDKAVVDDDDSRTETRKIKATYREVLKQPRPEDIGRHFGEDTSLLLVLLTRRVVVFLAGALAAADTRVTRVTCGQWKFQFVSLLLENLQRIQNEK